MNIKNDEKEWFINCLQNRSLIEKLKKINLIITDVDGCLTDGKIYYSNNNEILKAFSVQDGFLINQCTKNNILHIAIITGRKDKALENRAKVLGIHQDLLYQGIDSKKSDVILEIQNKKQITKEQTLYFGDDILDLETKSYSSLFTCPNDAIFYVSQQSDIIIPKKGGNGAFRILLDLLLYIQKRHPAQKEIKKILQ